MPGEEVKGVTFSVRKGEVLGIGGLAGQGKLGIANGLMGMYPVIGDVEFKGEKLDVSKTDETLKKGICAFKDIIRNDDIEDPLFRDPDVTREQWLRKLVFVPSEVLADLFLIAGKVENRLPYQLSLKCSFLMEK